MGRKKSILSQRFSSLKNADVGGDGLLAFCFLVNKEAKMGSNLERTAGFSTWIAVVQITRVPLGLPQVALERWLEGPLLFEDQPSLQVARHLRPAMSKQMEITNPFIT